MDIPADSATPTHTHVRSSTPAPANTVPAPEIFASGKPLAVSPACATIALGVPFTVMEGIVTESWEESEARTV